MSKEVVLEFHGRPRALPYMLRAVRPVRRPVTLTPSLVARWRGHRVDRVELAAFYRITGLSEGPALHLLYPHVFGFRLSMALLTHPTFPVPIWGVLQTRNHLVEHRPITAGDTLDFEAQVTEGRAVPKGAEFDLRTTVQLKGALAWESVVTFFTRGRFGEPGPASDLARSPPAPALTPADGSPGPDAGSLAAESSGTEVSANESSATGSRAVEWTMRNTGHVQFGRLTGDYNGIHLWDAYARRFGFSRALYHPPRVLGECLAHLSKGTGSVPPTRLDAWLKGPVLHGAHVRLGVAREPGGTTFALYADEERPCIVGRVHMQNPA